MTKILVNDTFILYQGFEKGSFGIVHYGWHKDDFNKKVAIKLEALNAKHKQLKYEAKCLKDLEDTTCVPKIWWDGVQDSYYVMVSEFIGPSLDHIFGLCMNKFMPETIADLGYDMVLLLKKIHEKGYIHRDLKPQNFVVCFKKRDPQVFLIDFGLCYKYLTDDNKHIPKKKTKGFVGTLRYASVYCHEGYALSRRDDLEALGYILAYFSKGNLPWQNIKIKDKKEHYAAVEKLKKNAKSTTLTEEKELSAFIDKVKTLKFDQIPSYDYYLYLFSKMKNSLLRGEKKDKYNEFKKALDNKCQS